MPRSATRTGSPVSRERLPAIPTAIERTPSRQSAGRASGSSPAPIEDVGEQERVAAAVSAFAVHDRNLVRRFPVPLDDEALALGAERSRCSGGGGARVEHRVQSFVGEDRAALDDVEFDAALGAVDGDAIALPRRVGVEGVADSVAPEA